MIIKSEESASKTPFSGCNVWEYPFHSKVLNIAKADISGRYPEHGMALNTACEEVYYVLAGEGMIQIGDEISMIKQGDVCIIPKSFTYCIEGNVQLIIATSPPWTPEQHRNV